MKETYSERLSNYIKSVDFLVRVIRDESQNTVVPASIVLSAAAVQRNMLELEKYAAEVNEHRKS